MRGAVGGNVAGAASKELNLGALGNTLSGAIGGGVGGQILTALVPMLAGAGTNFDVGAIIGQVAGGGIAGAILTAVVGFLINKMGSRPVTH